MMPGEDEVTENPAMGACDSRVEAEDVEGI